MALQPAGGFRLNVLNRGGRDPEQHFGAEAASEVGPHAPVNFHAYAACTGGSFLRETDVAIAARNPVLLLLRGDFRESQRALAALQKAGVRVAVSLKETGLHQIADQLSDPGRLSRFVAIVTQADGCIAPTPEAADIYRALRGDAAVAFIPTPYPVHDARWDFSKPIRERSGIFVGTREWDVPSRNHFAALVLARQISEQTGETVTVYDFAGRKGARLLRELNFAPEKLRVLTDRSGYASYLRILAEHKVVLQMDTSFVPGQVAGDALLCRVPCVGGNGAIDRLGYPRICGAARSGERIAQIATDLLTDDNAYGQAVADCERAATERLSFAKVADELTTFFASPTV